MKRLFLLAVTAVAANTLNAQIPNGYYNSAQNLSGPSLKAALHDIVRNHGVLTYTPGLWQAYYYTDVYPAASAHAGKLWDIYADHGNGSADYYYTMGSDQCGSSTQNYENDCYNREHIWPQSYFSSAEPMYTDLFLVYPTDHFVNGKRGNAPYAPVITANWSSSNGTRLGPPSVSIPNYSGVAFEPIDSFKGDIARSYFYLEACYYQDNVSGTSQNPFADGFVMKPWMVQQMLAWNALDPVSPKEIDRNNAVYYQTGQQNRNPFIDHPEWIDCIWGSGNCTTVTDTPDTGNSTAIGNVSNKETSVQLYPNPARDYVYLDWQKLPATGQINIECFNMEGKSIWHTAINNHTDNHYILSVSNFPAGVYMVRISSNQHSVSRKLIKY